MYINLQAGGHGVGVYSTNSAGMFHDLMSLHISAHNVINVLNLFPVAYFKKYIIDDNLQKQVKNGSLFG